MKFKFEISPDLIEGAARLTALLGHELGDGITVRAEPTPNGLHPLDLENIFECLSNNEKIEIIGFDLVEVASDKLGELNFISFLLKLIFDIYPTAFFVRKKCCGVKCV